MKTLVLAAGAIFAASSAMASDFCQMFPSHPSCVTAVPEISALEGTAALAAVAAIVLMVWERRRRA